MGFTSSSNRELAITITAEDEGASEAFNDVEQSAIDTRTAVAGLGAVMAGAGALGLAKATQAAANFEQQMVEVEKVTNPKTAREMSDAIREMAETIPLAHKELANIAAAAGRFGVKGTENIRQFTESVAKMSIATDLSAQRAGKAFAKLAELTGTPISKMENLGSSINKLSNNFATSSSEIVDAMTRSAGALSTLGLGQTQIAGLSAALNEVSESSERAGTRLRRLGQELMNPENVSKIASAFGVTTKEFRQMRESNPAGVIRKMATAMAEGGKRAKALKKTLSTTSRQALTALSQNLKGLDTAMSTANTSFKKASSLQKEFDAATSTLNSRLKLLKNRLTNIGIQIGNQIIPVLNTLIAKITPAIEAFSRFNKSMDGLPGLLILVGTTLAGLGALAVTVGPAIVSALSPILAPVAAITAAVGLLYYAWKNNLGGIRRVTRKVIRALKSSFSKGSAELRALQQVIDTFATAAKLAFNLVKRVVTFVITKYVVPLIKRLRRIWNNNIQDILVETRKTFKFLEKAIKGASNRIKKFWRKWGTEIKTIAKAVFGALKLIIGTTFRAILTTIKVILALIRGDFDQAFTYIKQFVVRTFKDIQKFLKGSFKKGLKAALKLVRGVIDWAVSGITSTISKGLKAAKKDIRGWLNTIKKWISPFTSTISDAIKKVQNLIDEVKNLNDMEVTVPTVGDILGGDDDGGDDSSPNGDPYNNDTRNDLIDDDTPVGLASGGIVDSATLAMIGEAGSEAVVPLDKLSSYLDTAFVSGVATQATQPVTTAPSGAQSVEHTFEARLSVEGDDELARLIKENAEIVVEEHESDKEDRIARL